MGSGLLGGGCGVVFAAYITIAGLCYWAFPHNPSYAFVVLPMMILGGIGGIIVCGSLLLLQSDRR